MPAQPCPSHTYVVWICTFHTSMRFSSRFKNSSPGHLHTCTAQCQFYDDATLTCVSSNNLLTQRGRGNVWHRQQESLLTYIKPNTLWTNYGKKRGGVFVWVVHIFRYTMTMQLHVFWTCKSPCKFCCHGTGITQYPRRTCLCLYFWTTHSKGDEQLKKNNPRITWLALLSWL